MKRSTNSRSSFDDENTNINNRSSKEASHCTKYRKISNNNNNNKSDDDASSKRKKQRVVLASVVRTTTKKSTATTALQNLRCFQQSLFGCSEFLPLDHAKKAATIHKQRMLFSFEVDTNKLTDDALGLCFFSGYLDTFEVLRLTKVSKRIRQIAFQQVTMLDLRNCKQITPPDVAFITSSFQNLTDLNFSYCSQFGEVHLEQLIPISKTLKKLNLRGTAVTDESISRFLVKSTSTYGECNLESIDLSATEKAGLIGDVTAHSLSTYCPNLKSLCLAWNANLTDDGVLSLKSLSKLKELDLSLTNVTTKSSPCLLEMMRNCPLTQLDLSATKLDLEGMSNLLFSSTVPFPYLKRLTLRFLKDLTPQHIEAILYQAPELVFLDVTHSGSDGQIPLSSLILKTFQERGIILKGACVARTSAPGNKARLSTTTSDYSMGTEEE